MKKLLFYIKHWLWSRKFIKTIKLLIFLEQGRTITTEEALKY